MLAEQLPLLRKRYEFHIASPEHAALRPGQKLTSRGIDHVMGERDEHGEPCGVTYYVKPTGTGKTIVSIDLLVGVNRSSRTGAPMWDKRGLILVPTNNLKRQYAAELGVQALRTPGKRYNFNNIPEDKIGVYNAEDKPEARQKAMDSLFTVMTYASFVNLTKKGLLNTADYDVAILDETHMNPHGEVTNKKVSQHLMMDPQYEIPEDADLTPEQAQEMGRFINEQLKKTNSKKGPFVLGATATHLYKSGGIVGDEVFGGIKPCHITTIPEAVQRGEICGFRNVVIQTKYNEHAHFDGDSELSDTERREVLKQNTRDDAAIRILLNGRDPATGEAYVDLKSVWYCKDIAHAEHLAEKINKALAESRHGKNYPEEGAYATAVSGKMDGKEVAEVLINYHRGKKGDPKALTNCKILIPGFDDESARLCFQVWSSQSPIETIQSAGRVLRLDPHNKKKIATVFTFLDPEKNVIPFGALAEGYFHVPDDYEFPHGGKGDEAIDKFEWPEEIRDLGAIYKISELRTFERERKKAAASKEKTGEYLTAEEMAKRLGVSPEWIERWVYGPLEAEYNFAQSLGEDQNRIKSITVRDGQQRKGEDTKKIITGDCWFPLTHMGYYKVSPTETKFCLHNLATGNCRTVLFNSRQIPRAPSYVYGMESVEPLLGITKTENDALKHLLEDSWFSRDKGERTLKVTYQGREASFGIGDDVLYCLHKAGGTPHIYLTATGLRKAYALTSGIADEQELDAWAQKQHLSSVKTPYWLNKSETEQALDIHKGSPVYDLFETYWRKLEKDAGNIPVKTLERQLGRGNEAYDYSLECGKLKNDKLPTSRPNEFCISRPSIQFFRDLISLGRDQQVSSARGGHTAKVARGAGGKQAEL